MKVIRPSGQERNVPRGVLGGAEISEATAGSHGIYLLMLAGQLEIRWGDSFEETLTIEPGDMLYVPPNETHLLRNVSETEPAEYVVARDSAADDSVEVPWSG